MSIKKDCTFFGACISSSCEGCDSYQKTKKLTNWEWLNFIPNCILEEMVHTDSKFGQCCLCILNGQACSNNQCYEEKKELLEAIHIY